MLQIWYLSYIYGIIKTRERGLMDYPNRGKRIDNGEWVDGFLYESTPLCCFREDYELQPRECYICVTPKQVVQAPLNAVKAFYAELSSIIESYESFGRRNQRAKDKSPKQLNKHAMHLVRLYLMVFDILEKGEINTYREKDHNLSLIHI